MARKYEKVQELMPEEKRFKCAGNGMKSTGKLYTDFLICLTGILLPNALTRSE